MCYLSIKSLPEVCFAHIFGAENYKNTLYPRQDEIEVSYVSEGSLTVCHENQFYTVNQGDFACFFHGTADVVSSDTFHEHHTVCFNMQFELTDVKVKNSLVLPVYIGSIYNGDVCRKLIDDIIKTHTICPDDGMKCTVLFLQLLNELNYGVAGESRQQSSGMSLYVHKAKRYIYEHINEPIRQNDIAKHIGITPEYLCSVFKKSQGVSVISFITRIKLEKIRTVMKSENMSLRRASLLYGYDDPNYVSRLYKKYFNINITDAVF